MLKKLEKIITEVNDTVQAIDPHYQVVDDCGLSLEFVPTDAKPFPIAWFTCFVKGHYVRCDTPSTRTNENVEKIQDVFHQEGNKQLVKLGNWAAIDYARQIDD